MNSPRSVDPDSARIVEIGAHAYMKEALPDRTQLLWTYYKVEAPTALNTPFTLRTAWRIWRSIRANEIDLIVVWTSPYAPWNFRQLKALVKWPVRPLAALVRIFGVQFLRLVSTRIPIVAIDQEDSRTVARHNLFLLDKSKYFFKRELPVDRWQVFQGSAHAGLPGYSFRMNPRHRRRIEKLRPFSLGARLDGTTAMPSAFPEKTSDVFVALTMEGGTTVRDENVEQLRALARSGIKVDFAAQRLSRTEYFERMARAWLTWSPEGLGWDCFRHYEAPLAYCVPIINNPTIIRYQPLIDGMHAFYYPPDDPNALAQKITVALADKPRLRQMAERARVHVLQYHVRPQPFVDNLLRMGLGLDDAPGGILLD